MPVSPKIQKIIDKTNHVAINRIEKQEDCKESTVKGMSLTLKTLLQYYKGDRK